MARNRLRRSDLIAPFRGVRVSGADFGLLERAEALLAVLGPGAVLSHLTAARLWPLELPAALPDEPLHVSVRALSRAPRRPGVVGHAASDPRVRRLVRFGLPLTDGASLFCHLGELLELDDLVAGGDALVRMPAVPDPADPRPWVLLARLHERVESFHGRGATRLREAVALVRDGPDSRPVAWEYEGDGHRTSNRRFAHDIGRYDDLAAIGVRVVGAEFIRCARVRAGRMGG
ncbi:hypothetical protein ACVLV4_002078 [Rathayibacter agropyri]